MVPAIYISTLLTVSAQLQGIREVWVVTGSLGLALQGVHVAVHDIDIQTNEPGAYEIAGRLANYVVRPVSYSSSDTICSHLGALSINGMAVEIIGDARKRTDAGGWEDPVDLRLYRQYVQVAERRIPVLSLDYELVAYSRLGRTDKIELLKKWLEHKHGREY